MMMYPPYKSEEAWLDDLCRQHRDGAHDETPLRETCPLCDSEENMRELEILTLDQLEGACRRHDYNTDELTSEIFRRLREAEAFRVDVIKRCEAMMKLTKGA